MPEPWSPWGELRQYKEVDEVVLPKYSDEYKDAKVMEGEEVLTLRPEERGTQKTVCKHRQDSQRKMGAAVDG